MTPASIQSEIRKLAREFYERRKAAWSTPPEWRDVSPSQFPHVDVNFYDRASQDFTAAGFRFLGDKENVTLAKLFPEQQTFVRAFIGDDYTTTASVWHTRPLGRSRVNQFMYSVTRTNIRGIALSTEFEGGTYLMTDNIKGFGDGTRTPGIEVQRLGQQAPISSLLKLHRTTLAERRSFGARVVPVHTAADVLASGQRLHALRAAHMAHIGYFDPRAEVARWSDRLSPDALRLLLAELKSIHDSTSPPP